MLKLMESYYGMVFLGRNSAAAKTHENQNLFFILCRQKLVKRLYFYIYGYNLNILTILFSFIVDFFSGMQLHFSSGAWDCFAL